MSKAERNSKTIQYITTSNESVSRKYLIPTQTSKTMNTESHQYFNQQSLSKNNITERPHNTFYQQNSKKASKRKIQQNLNSNFMGKKRVIKGNSKFTKGNANYTNPKCSCDHSSKSNQIISLKCRFCGKKKAKNNFIPNNRDFCTCDYSKKQFFRKTKLGSTKYGKKEGYEKYGYQTNNNQFANYGYQLNNTSDIFGYQLDNTSDIYGYQLDNTFDNYGYQLNNTFDNYGYQYNNQFDNYDYPLNNQIDDYQYQLNNQISNYGYKSNNRQKKVSSNNSYMNSNLYNSRTYQGRRNAHDWGIMPRNQTLLSRKTKYTYASHNNLRLPFNIERNKYLSLSSGKGKRIETDSYFCTCPNEKRKYSSLSIGRRGKRIEISRDFCTCPNDQYSNYQNSNTYSYSKQMKLLGNSNNKNKYLSLNQNNFRDSTNDTYNYSKNINLNNINRSYSYDNRVTNRIIKNINILLSQKCVGQNNESLQILATEKPKLVAQCVQDMQVIQEPKPIQIILPIQQNEIDYALGLEIYGKNTEEEKRALKEAEKLRKQMEITPDNALTMYFNKEYETIIPHFDNLYVVRKDRIFCKKTEERKNKFEDNIVKEKKAFSVEPYNIGIVKYNGLNKVWEPFTVENEEMKIYGDIKNFNKFNKKVLTTKMLVKGTYKPDWNDLNEAIKTTKMNIDGVFEPEEEEEPEEESEEEVRKPEPIIIKKEPKKKKKPIKKPIKKKPVKKVIKKIVKKEPEKDIEDDIEEESQEQVLDIENFDLNLEESGRHFGLLRIQTKTYNYKGVPKPKEVIKPDKNKYNKNEILLDKNDKLVYPAEFKKDVDWNKKTYPMSGRPFTIEKKAKPTLSTKKVEKMSIRPSYKTKDWNNYIKERNVIKINMPVRKARKLPLSKNRIQPVILKGKEKTWNTCNKKENDTKIQIDKTVKKTTFNISKESDIYIENEAEEILVNDDYNIVEENYARPIRANIRKVEDYTEESASSEYDILKNITKHEDQFNQFKELVSESIKISGQKIIINDISGKYKRKVEIFQGLDENFEKLANDQKYHKKFDTTVKEYVTKSVARNIEQSRMIKKAGEDGVEFYGKKIVQNQINDGPVQQKVSILDSKVSSSGGEQHRKITYEPEHENELESKEDKSREGYYKEIKKSSGIKVSQELEQDQEQNDIGQIKKEQIELEHENNVENKQQMNIEMNNRIKFITKEQMLNDKNEGQIAGRGQHIEYAYEEEEDSGSHILLENEEDENENLHENESEQEIDLGGHQLKEDIQPDGQIRKVQYIYSEQNIPQGQVIHQEQKTIIHSQSQQGQYINLSNNNSTNQKQSPKSLQEENIGKRKHQLYIKEITNFEPSPEQNQNKLNYITLKKRDNQDDEDSQPQDGQPQDQQPRRIIIQNKEQIIHQENEEKNGQDKEQGQGQEQQQEAQEQENTHEQVQEHEKENEKEQENEQQEQDNEKDNEHEEYKEEEEQEDGEEEEEQVEGEEEQLEGEEQENEEENEQNPDDAVNLRSANIQANNQTIPQIISSAVNQINANNSVINQSNLLNNQAQDQSQAKNQLLRAKIITQTRENKEINNNQINIQRQQQIITQSPNGQILSQQHYSNEVRNALISDNSRNLQNAQITGSIKYEKNSQNKDTIIYAFGQKASTNTGQNLMNAENSDFLVSSLRNQNNQNIMESKMVINSSQVSNGKIINNSNVVNSGGKVEQIQMSGNQKGMSSPGQDSRRKKEPIDTDSRKKKIEENEENVKKEINEFPLEPRDSKKK